MRGVWRKDAEEEGPGSKKGIENISSQPTAVDGSLRTRRHRSKETVVILYSNANGNFITTGEEDKISRTAEVPSKIPLQRWMSRQ
jgi:hypothetical protein